MASLASEQAVFMLHTLRRPALKAEHAMTGAVIAAMPLAGRLSRHSNSRSAFDLAWHVVSVEIKTLDADAILGRRG